MGLLSLFIVKENLEYDLNVSAIAIKRSENAASAIEQKTRHTYIRTVAKSEDSNEQRLHTTVL